MVCEEFVIFKSSPVCGHCAVVLPDFVPVLERSIFPNKSPYRDFHPVLEKLFFFGLKISIGIFSWC